MRMRHKAHPHSFLGTESERNVPLLFVIVVFATDGCALFGSQFDGTLHVLHRTLLVALGQLHTATLVVGLSKGRLDFHSLVVHGKGTIVLLLRQVIAALQQIGFLAERIQRKHIVHQLHGLFLVAAYGHDFRLQEQGVLVLGVEGQ